MSTYKTVIQRAIGSLRRRRTPDAHETPPATTYQPYSSETLMLVNGIGFGLYAASERFPREQDRLDSRKALGLLPRYGLSRIPIRYLDDLESLRIETEAFFESIMSRRPEEIYLPVLVTIMGTIIGGHSGFPEISQFIKKTMPKHDGPIVATNVENP